MFHRILVANRGEVASRIITTCHSLGIEAVAICTDEDRDSPHTLLADHVVCLSSITAFGLTNNAPKPSYVSIPCIIAAAIESKAQAIHPGYGFLSENPDFEEACRAAGIVFIGPSHESLVVFGDKAATRQLAKDLNLPVLPGSVLCHYWREVNDNVNLIGFPCMIKVPNSGGGRGLYHCYNMEELLAVKRQLIPRPSRMNLDQMASMAADEGNKGQVGEHTLANLCVADDADWDRALTSPVFVESFLRRARHVEVQVLGNGDGQLWILGDRDCSVQRNHQKVVEEAPAPWISKRLRQEIYIAAARIMSATRYASLGTVEFLVDLSNSSSPSRWSILEVNPRLQVEHTVTEATLGLDLVELMIRQACQVWTGKQQKWWEAAKVANPEEPFLLPCKGHAVQVRVYAEDVERSFIAVSGVVQELRWASSINGHFDPLAKVRCDETICIGTQITPHFDTLLTKLIVHAPNRTQALRELRTVLRDTVIRGLTTNLNMLLWILNHQDFVLNRIHTTWLSAQQAHIVHPGIRVESITQHGGFCQAVVVAYPGRTCFWNVGIPPSGPMDSWAFRVGNALVGNPANSEFSGLEILLVNSTLQLRFHIDSLVAITGSQCNICREALATINGSPIPRWHPVFVHRGCVLQFQSCDHEVDQRQGSRVYLCVAGGLGCASIMGSQTTFLMGRIGGMSGRAIQVGDWLPLQKSIPNHCAETLIQNFRKFVRPVQPKIIPMYAHDWTVRVLIGPHGAPDHATSVGLGRLINVPLVVSPQSNRSGIRLESIDMAWARKDGGEAGQHPSNVDDYCYPYGAINMSGNTPVILAEDGPSLGGFVCLASVITADRWRLGQMSAGDLVNLTPVSLSNARRLLMKQEALLTWISDQLAQPYSEQANQQRAASVSSFPGNSICHELFSTFLDARSNSSSGIILDSPFVNGFSVPRPGSARYRLAGDCGVLVEFETHELGPTLDFRARIHALERWISNDAKCNRFGLHLSPGVRTLLVQYNPFAVELPTLMRLLIKAESSLDNWMHQKIPARILRLPIHFDDDTNRRAIVRYQRAVRAQAPYLPDNIDYIARLNRLSSREEVLHHILKTVYVVIGLGDVYMGSPCAVPLRIQDRLFSSKYNPARTFTPNSAVGLGGMYMCIYGIDSPGGYQLVGRTLPVWELHPRHPAFGGKPWLLRAFDHIQFEEVSASRLEVMRREFLEGRLQLNIQESVFDVAAYVQELKNHREELLECVEERRKLLAENDLLFSDRHMHSPIANPLSEHRMSNEEIFRLRLNQGQAFVRSPCSGVVLQLFVSANQNVFVGDTLLILESMKIQLVIHAEHAGRVVGVFCQVGQIVSEHFPLVMIQEPSSEQEQQSTVAAGASLDNLLVVDRGKGLSTTSMEPVSSSISEKKQAGAAEEPPIQQNIVG
jgi:urea carboxylase